MIQASKHQAPLLSTKQLSAQHLDRLNERITKSILLATGSAEDRMLADTVRAAVNSFVATSADVNRATASVAHLMEDIGARQGRNGHDGADLATSFRAALVTTQKGLPSIYGNQVTRDTLLLLRESLVAYLTELQIHAHAGLMRARRSLETAPDSRGQSSQRALGTDPDVELKRLLGMEKAHPDQEIIAIVSLAAPIPHSLTEDPLTIDRPSMNEVLLPAHSNLDRVANLLTGQAVASPPVSPLNTHQALALARQAADLLRHGTVTDTRTLVLCADMVSALVTQANPLLAQLAIDKHLQNLSPMSPRRRVTLGELLLHTLENGQPMAASARDLGITRRTAHSRMKLLRTMYGEALKDPDQRIELTVALRTALPRWRLDLAHLSD